jgi:preprotein translocase subunit SecA
VAAYERKLAELDAIEDESTGGGFGERLLALVMLNVLDEKWKDHLYDLDQLRAAIHYRSWGQKDPLVEYKGEAYTMFVDLMHDVADSFTDRFLKAQLSFGGGDDFGGGYDNGLGGFDPRSAPPLPAQPATKRYNAFGILEDIPAEELAAMGDGGSAPNGQGGSANTARNGANGNGAHASDNAAPKPRARRFDALGRVIEEDTAGGASGVQGGAADVVEATYDGDGADAPVPGGSVVDIGPSEPPDVRPVAKPDPAV